jgi:hypothetical protein
VINSRVTLRDQDCQVRITVGAFVFARSYIDVKDFEIEDDCWYGPKLCKSTR